MSNEMNIGELLKAVDAEQAVEANNAVDDSNIIESDLSPAQVGSGDGETDDETEIVKETHIPETASITIRPLVCVTYRANPHVLEYPFVAATEKGAFELLYAWLDNQKPVVKHDSALTINVSGASSGNTGKKWFWNKSTQKFARVAPSDIFRYKAEGWIERGPRNKSAT